MRYGSGCAAEIGSLDGADCLAAACANIMLGIHGDHFQTHVVSVVKGGDGFLAEGRAEVGAEQFRFLTTEEEETWRAPDFGVFTDDASHGDCVPVPPEFVEGGAGVDVGERLLVWYRVHVGLCVRVCLSSGHATVLLKVG